MTPTSLASVEQALEDLRHGKMIILVDNESRENEGDLVMAAQHITPQAINFMTHHARGLICLSLQEEDFTRLGIPMMVQHNRSAHQTAFGVSIEAANGVGTGISAFDRARTIQVAIDDKSSAADVIMPGHIFPLKACPGGVLTRAGHTEGSVDLVRLAGLKPAAVICEVLHEDGHMARLPDLKILAEKHQLNKVSIDDLIMYRMQKESIVKLISSAVLPIKQQSQPFTIKIFQNQMDGREHVALVSQTLNTESPCLVRLHSECLTGDVFGSTRCDCGPQLKLALSAIAKEGGILIYLRQEGRGIGLGNKIKAYTLQDAGLDTVEANQELGFVADMRDYGIAAQILKKLEVKSIRLLTNNPAKVSSLQAYGITVEQRVALETQPNPDNINYLKTKQEKLGHLLILDKESCHV